MSESRRNQRSVGQVITMRVNPTDIMSCIDLVELSGMKVSGMSLALAVKLALAGCLQAARENKTIPERTGFEYAQLVESYLNVKQEVKTRIADRVRDTEYARIALDQPHFAGRTSGLLQDDSPVNPDIPREAQNLQARIYKYMKGWIARRDADPDNFDASQEAKLERCREIYRLIDDGQYEHNIEGLQP